MHNPIWYCCQCPNCQVKKNTFCTIWDHLKVNPNILKPVNQIAKGYLGTYLFLITKTKCNLMLNLTVTWSRENTHRWPCKPTESSDHHMGSAPTYFLGGGGWNVGALKKNNKSFPFCVLPLLWKLLCRLQHVLARASAAELGTEGTCWFVHPSTADRGPAQSTQSLSLVASSGVVLQPNYFSGGRGGVI